MDNVDEDYVRFVHHLHDSAKGAESLKTTKRRMSQETLELSRQRGAARESDNYQMTSELAKLCREAIKEDLKEKGGNVGWSCRGRFEHPQCPAELSQFQGKDNHSPTSRVNCHLFQKAMEKVIHDFYSDLFDSHVHLLPSHHPQDGYVIPSVLPSVI
ncbi:unnamed protein product [Heligmosomoides polygyrus]|uniref:BAR domain-containing protein n=1 Tax=Heligmosomoides polygyrus TaxID=6339 RepID=A0A183FJZ6_HELPZ|nr:unnamed protein product [Heligmosomoides polygyrus]